MDFNFIETNRTIAEREAKPYVDKVEKEVKQYALYNGYNPDDVSVIGEYDEILKTVKLVFNGPEKIIDAIDSGHISFEI